MHGKRLFVDTVRGVRGTISQTEESHLPLFTVKMQSCI
ncbi:unnamed protein product [Haemonchus placei]|uniref:50S ribosomal protein L23 n=1 Tax=Haemonchus placei TaxID=6290 RepID=A0A0N4X7I9_HAEPC|nr:unnamed protein product [Haemonchus placei]